MKAFILILTLGLIGCGPSGPHTPVLAVKGLSAQWKDQAVQTNSFSIISVPLNVAHPAGPIGWTYANFNTNGVICIGLVGNLQPTSFSITRMEQPADASCAALVDSYTYTMTATTLVVCNSSSACTSYE